MYYQLYNHPMIGPYNTSDYPITIVVVSLINIVVPLFVTGKSYYVELLISLRCGSYLRHKQSKTTFVFLYER